MYILQKQLDNLRQLLIPGKVVVLYGASRTGKTTLVQEFIKEVKEPSLVVSGEDIAVHDFLASQSVEKMRAFVGASRLLIIDEAQRIAGIGLNLKLIVDHIEGIRVIATGSSSFDLARHAGEPLTGRRYTLLLYPLAQLEIGQMENPAQTAANLESRLIYGSYPEIVLTADNRRRDDVGLLWENYLVMERLKKQEYLNISANNYFWRTYTKQEIDFVEERGGRLYGFEMKWGKGRNRPPREWAAAYPEATWQVVDRNNYLDFIC